MFDGGLLVLVQVNLDQLRAVELDADTLANNFSGEHQIIEDGIVHGGQGTAAWALLFVRIGTATAWLGHNLTFANEDYVLAGEFLFQFAHQAGLDLLERLLLGNRNVDDNSLKSQSTDYFHELQFLKKAVVPHDCLKTGLSLCQGIFKLNRELKSPIGYQENAP